MSHSDCTKLVFVSVSWEIISNYRSALKAFINYCVSLDDSLDKVKDVEDIFVEYIHQFYCLDTPL